MKNVIFSIVLLTNISVRLYASDQKAFSDIDKNIFTVNGRIASPYNTQFIDSLSNAYFVIESDPIKALYTNAYERAMGKSVVTVDDFETTDWGPYISKLLNDRQYLNKLPQFIYHVIAVSGDIRQQNPVGRVVDNTRIIIPEFIYHFPAASGDIRQQNPVGKVVDNTLIMVPENGLFTLLQYTYGIKRDGEKAHILLSSDGIKTVLVKPLLMKLLNKYRSHEQQDTAIEQQRYSSSDIKEGELYFRQ